MLRIKRYIYWCYSIFKVLIAWVFLHLFRRKLLNENIWIVREKRNEARDNGFHFFTYLREKHPELNVYYIITTDSPDIKKVEKYGNLIKADSFKHCIYYLAAKYSISSQAYGAYPYYFNNKIVFLLQKLCKKNQKVIFLQHGIYQNEIAGEFEYKKCNIDYFVCTAEREYNFIKDRYNYPNNALGRTGLARYDKLYGCTSNEKIVLIMPTWRRWLSCESNINIPTDKEKEIFLNSDYYKAYASILSDKSLIEFLRDKQYRIVFYMHYKFQGYTDVFRELENNVIQVAAREDFDVQELLINSRVLITDYSSVHFDFAYMNKPLIYYQFDKQQFNSSHYAKGYFSYENDGFGLCCNDTDFLIEEIKALINNNCEQPYKYENRVNQFFSIRDKNNCERIYEAICNL